MDDGSVELWTENREAARVYMVVRGQVIVGGMGGIVDLSIPAVKIVMDLFGVEQQRDCLMKIMRLFDTLQAKRNQERGE